VTAEQQTLLLRVLPTRWRRKPAGIDTERNYVTVSLCIFPRFHVYAICARRPQRRSMRIIGRRRPIIGRRSSSRPTTDRPSTTTRPPTASLPLPDDPPPLCHHPTTHRLSTTTRRPPTTRVDQPTATTSTHRTDNGETTRAACVSTE